MRVLARFVVAGTLALPSAAVAQGVVVHNTADVRFYGALGSIASLATRMGGGNMHNLPSTTSVSGHKLRTESSDQATIIDADAGRITQLNLKQKTYTSMTFAEMAAAMAQATQQARQAKDQRAQEAKANQSKNPDAPKGDMNVKYAVAVDRSGQHEKIAGYDAERVFLTITMEGEATPEGEKTQQVGSLVFLLDQWIAKDAPQIAALQEFQRAYAQQAGQAFHTQVQGLQAAFAADPRIKGGFEAAAKELAKVPGVSLRSMTYVALVPPGLAFDRKLVLNDADAGAKADAAAPKEEKPKGGFRGLMGALKSAADEASKKQSSNQNGAGDTPKQTTLMSVKDEVVTITAGAVPADAFTVPAGFREIKPKAPSGR